MTVTIYHNPKCSKSRQTLELIREQGGKPTIIEYIKNAPTESDISQLIADLKLESALPMMRAKDAAFKEAGLSKESDNAELLAELIKNPKLLERPIVVSDKGAAICRPPELVLKLL